MMSRKTFLTCLAMLALAAFGCGKKEEAPAPTEPAAPAAPEAPAADKPLTIGFVYVGPRDDFGYNQAHSEGAKAIASLPGVKILEEEKVPETMDVQPPAKAIGAIVHGELRRSKAFCEKVVNLPLFYGIREDERETAVTALASIVGS